MTFLSKWITDVRYALHIIKAVLNSLPSFKNYDVRFTGNFKKKFHQGTSSLTLVSTDEGGRRQGRGVGGSQSGRCMMLSVGRSGCAVTSVLFEDQYKTDLLCWGGGGGGVGDIWMLASFDVIKLFYFKTL